MEGYCEEMPALQPPVAVGGEKRHTERVAAAATIALGRIGLWLQP
jgi:hypothetical protein